MLSARGHRKGASSGDAITMMHEEGPQKMKASPLRSRMGESSASIDVFADDRMRASEVGKLAKNSSSDSVVVFANAYMYCSIARS